MPVRNKRQQAFVSVIILNYNGERTLDRVIAAVQAQTYADKEIIVVDNASQDSSREYLQQAVKQGKIRVIFSDKNLGFSAGNNLGIAAAQGDYIALLNNDGVPEPQWLESLVKVMESDPNCAAVNSKLLLYPNFALKTLPHDDRQEVLSVHLTRSELLPLFRKDHLNLNWQTDETGQVGLELQISPQGEPEVEVEVMSLDVKGKKSVKKKVVNTSKLSTYQKIQNAGIVVFPSGYGRDRGALVRASTQHYEVDSDQFLDGEEVFAVCAGASLYHREKLEFVGSFDNQFFLYYEDVELSERLRLAGFTCRYANRAVVRHLHAASSQEGSAFFAFHAERGRLLHLILHFPVKTILQELFIFGLMAGRHLLRRRTGSLLVLWSVFINSPELLRKRLGYKRRFTRENRERWERDVHSGRWLFERSL